MKISELVEKVHAVKLLKRKGWIDSGIEKDITETVGSHSYGVAVLIMLLDSMDMIPPHLSKDKLYKIALLHDLPESIVGDITPRDGISAQEKENLELDAVSTIFGGDGRWASLKNLSLRYIKESGCIGEVNEFTYIQQLDKLDMMIQALLYERHLCVNLCEFYQNIDEIIEDQHLKQLFHQVKIQLNSNL